MMTSYVAARTTGIVSLDNDPRPLKSLMVHVPGMCLCHTAAMLEIVLAESSAEGVLMTYN